jgi:hypothetical protein
MIEGQESLQIPWRDSGHQGDWLAAFFTQVGQLPVDLRRKMRPRIASSKTIVKLLQILGEHRLQSTDLIGIHAKPSSWRWNGDKLPQFANSYNINITQSN